MQPFLSRVHSAPLRLKYHSQFNSNRSSGLLLALQQRLFIYESFVLFRYSNSFFSKPKLSGKDVINQMGATRLVTRSIPVGFYYDKKPGNRLNHHSGLNTVRGQASAPSRIIKRFRVPNHKACPNSIRGSGWCGYDFLDIYLI